MHSNRLVAASLALALTMSAPASALTFNITTAPNATLSTAQAAAFDAAAAAWSAVLIDNITVNLQVGFVSTLGQNILGSTSLTFAAPFSTSGVVAALATDARSTDDAKAVASFQALPPGNATMLLTSAQAKALGATLVGTDAIIEFSTNFQFATTRNADGSTPQGFYDLIGVAQHEIGHALGFVSSFDFSSPQQTNVPTLLDEYRFTALNTRATATGSAYFSLNDGLTSFASFSPGGTGQYQASHWLQGTGALMDPAVATGVSQNITALDIQALDVLGYDIAVPEPGSLAILLVGMAGAALMRRRPLSPMVQAAAR